MKKRFYLYAVSYYYVKDNGKKSGYGCMQIKRSKKINTFSDFDSVRNLIISENRFEDIIILNIMFIGTERCA